MVSPGNPIVMFPCRNTTVFKRVYIRTRMWFVYISLQGYNATHAPECQNYAPPYAILYFEHFSLYSISRYSSLFLTSLYLAIYPWGLIPLILYRPQPLDLPVGFRTVIYRYIRAGYTCNVLRKLSDLGSGLCFARAMKFDAYIYRLCTFSSFPAHRRVILRVSRDGILYTCIYIAYRPWANSVLRCSSSLANLLCFAGEFCFLLSVYTAVCV